MTTEFDRVRKMKLDDFVEWVCSRADSFYTPSQNKNRRRELRKQLRQNLTENSKT